MPSYILHGGQLLDPRRDDLVRGVEVLIEGERVREVSSLPIQAPHSVRIDLGGRTLMPGLIDAHVHMFLPEVNFALLENVSLTLLAAKATAIARCMLMRGFTTVRDVGGADWGMKEALAMGIVDGPRLFIAGRALTQTGGQADVRSRNESGLGNQHNSALHYWSRTVDGVPEMMKAVRDELRKGADHIKLMASGGVLAQMGSPQTPQFSLAEFEVACQEAGNWGSYVAAHAYSAETISRAVRSGVRTIEHGNLIDERTAELMVQRGAFLVPTLAIFDSLKRRGDDFGITTLSQQKNEAVLMAGLRSLEIAKQAGVAMGYGTDLIGDLHNDQSREFLLRAEVLTPVEIIRSATIVNAQLLRRERELGEIVPGAFADVLIVDGNPLKDLTTLQDEGARLSAIMKGGRFYKNLLVA